MLRLPPNCDLTLGVTCVERPEPGVTVWRMPADERFANPAGLVQGGFLAALADTAMTASTINWATGQGRRVVASTTDIRVTFLRPAVASGDLTATGRVLSGGRRVVFCEAEITDGAGRLVAKASSTNLLTQRE